jgi:hypothetical protein
MVLAQYAYVDFGIECDSAAIELIRDSVFGVGRVVGLFAFEAATRARGGGAESPVHRGNSDHVEWKWVAKGLHLSRHVKPREASSVGWVVKLEVRTAGVNARDCAAVLSPERISAGHLGKPDLFTMVRRSTTKITAKIQEGCISLVFNCVSDYKDIVSSPHPTAACIWNAQSQIRKN